MSTTRSASLSALFAGLLVAGAAGATEPLPSVDFGTLPASAQVRPANPNGQPHEALARLLSETSAVVPGVPFRLGVELTPNKGWHSYWKSPGDIGMPLTIAWDLPDGSTVERGPFPVPERFDQSSIVSYGYDGPVLVYDHVTLPAGTPAGSTIEVKATASWLVCEAICIPGEASLSLPLTVAAGGDDAAPTPWAPLFDAYAARHPTPFAAVSGLGIEHALSQSAYRPGDVLEVAFRVVPTGDEPVAVSVVEGTWPAFAPIVDSYQIYLYESSVTPQPDGSTLVVAKGDVLEVDSLPLDSRIGGLFQARVGGRWVQTEYTVEVPWVAAGTPVEPSTSPLWSLARGEAAPVETAPQPGQDLPSAPTMMLFAFLGGLILNVMPCVLPVVTLKLFGLVHHAAATPAERRARSMAYTSGVLVSFWVLAGAVLVAKATLGGVGWGFQFQSPTFVAVLAAIVFGFGLSLFGVFEIPVLGGDLAAKAAGREGVAGDFLNGVFATLLATPCSAPFLGPAIGFALLQPPVWVFGFFTLIALGLALPFVLVALAPAVLRALPRPGPWMDTFKQLLGFTLVATAVWLVQVLAGLVGVDGAMGFVGFLATLALGLWIFGRWGDVAQSAGRQLAAAAAGAAVTVAGAWALVDLAPPPEAECAEPDTLRPVEWSGQEIPWQSFSGAKVAAAAGRPVFIDFTADWCLTCKVNEKTVLSTDQVRDAMKEHDVVPLVADWTRRDPEITEWLARFGRAGVPFYLVVPADPSAAPIPLSEVITPTQVVVALERAVQSGG